MSEATKCPLTPHQICILAMHAQCDVSTVRRWAAGGRVWRTTAMRLQRALAKLEDEVADSIVTRLKRTGAEQTGRARGGRRSVPARAEA